MRILVTGGRKWTDRKTIRQNLFPYCNDGNVLIHGAAKGADSIAGEEWEAMGGEIEAYPAHWGTYGRAAGPIRNKQMLEEGKPDLVLAFHDDLRRSKGTADMVARARKVGLYVIVIRSEGR